jgi:hypothetical protein
MEKTYQEQIKETIDSICEKNNLKQPITVPSAGKMIAEYEGVDKAIELFEGKLKEVNENPDVSNPFAFSAYKVTLTNVLYPMKEKQT